MNSFELEIWREEKERRKLANDFGIDDLEIIIKNERWYDGERY